MLTTLLLSTALATTPTSIDPTQATAMLDLLHNCNTGAVPQAQIQQVIDLPGTQLIIHQQNISRRITPEQYKEVLTSACKGAIANIAPSQPGPRAAKGVQGLINDVAPSLLWGRKHIPELQQRLNTALKTPDLDRVVPLAQENLPQKIDLSPKLYFVMGGRAGAAASDDGIYIDLLQDAWKAKDTSTVMTPHEMVLFFAHETHHVGYGRILDQKKNALHLSPGQEQAWSFLTSILMEGSATLLINAEGSWSELETADHIKPDLARLPTLLPKAQEIFRRSLQNNLSKQDFEEAESNFTGEGYHATGAKLLYVIQKARGKKAVLEVMDHPQSLLKIYNQCAAEINEPFRFDPITASALETQLSRP